MISTMKAWNLTVNDANAIVDKANYVGNNYAISTGGIIDIIERAGSSMAAANTDLNKTIALGTAANTVVQNS